MKYQQEASTRTNFMNVSITDVNEAGILSTCDLLQEVNQNNDMIMQEVFGSNSFATAHAIHYSVAFISQATLGDTLKTEAAYTLSREGQLQVKISITKTKKRQSITVCTGSFTFINIPVTKKTTPKRANTILA